MPDGQKKGRVLASGNNGGTPTTLSNLIREGKSAQIYSSIQTGGNFKMQTLETALKEIYLKKLCDF